MRTSTSHRRPVGDEGDPVYACCMCRNYQEFDRESMKLAIERDVWEDDYQGSDYVTVVRVFESAQAAEVLYREPRGSWHRNDNYDPAPQEWFDRVARVVAHAGRIVTHSGHPVNDD